MTDYGMIQAQQRHQQQVDSARARVAQIQNAASGRDFTDQEAEELEWLLPTIEAANQAGPQRKTQTDQTYAAGVTGGHHQRIHNRFPGAKLSNGNWRSFGEFLATVGRRQSDPRFYDSMSEGSGPDGGYGVPTLFGGELVTDAIEASNFAKLADLVTMTSGTMQAWGFASSDHSSQSIYGGYTAEWRSEGETMTSQDPDLKRITLVSKKLGLYTVCSNELVQDGGARFEQGLRNAMVAAAAWHLDHALLRGTGAGQPLGIIPAGGTITQTKESGQADDTIVWANIVGMWARLAPQSQASRYTTWVVHPSTLPQLLSLSWEGSSTSVPFWLPASGASPLQTLMGKPVLVSEHASALGDAGDVCLVDWSQVILGIRLDMALAVSGHEKFSSDQTAFRLILRCDAQPKIGDPLTLAYGSDTVSPYVVLGSREGA